MDAQHAKMCKWGVFFVCQSDAWSELRGRARGGHDCCNAIKAMLRQRLHRRSTEGSKTKKLKAVTTSEVGVLRCRQHGAMRKTCWLRPQRLHKQRE